MIFILAGILAFGFSAFMHNGVPPLFDIAGSLLCIGFAPVLILYGIATDRFRMRGLDPIQKFCVSASGFAVDSALLKVEFKWESFSRAIETRHRLILFLKVGSALVLPRSVLIEAKVLGDLKQEISNNLGSKFNELSTS